MSTFGITKTANADADGAVPTDEHGRPTAWCGYCSNEGVAMLEGETTVDGVTYSRGSAPCPWCLQGELRYAEWTADTGIRKGSDKQGGKHVSHHRRLEPASGFTMFDVLETAAEPTRHDRFVPDAEWLLEREADGCPRGALMAIVRRELRPAEWRAGGGDREVIEGLGESDADEIRRRRALALQAKNEAEQEEGSP